MSMVFHDIVMPITFGTMYMKDWLKRAGKTVLIGYPKTVIRFFEYLGEFKKIKRATGKRFKFRWKDAHPRLTDKLINTPFDQHYIYHPAWAARKLVLIKPKIHIDISSILSFSSIISAIIPVKFYDYRPAKLNLSNYESDFADLLNLPFESDTIESLSCMHTIEHIGLGRYGDKLDADGDLKAIAELKRVLAPGGHLLFVTPVGKSLIEFNAHRIYSHKQVVEYFHPLVLKEFSLVPDAGGLIENADAELADNQNYGCGCYWFTKN